MPDDNGNVINFQDRLRQRDADESKATPTGAQVSIEPHFREVWLLIDRVLIEDLYEGTRAGFRMDSFYARQIGHLILRAAAESETLQPGQGSDDEPDSTA